MSYHQYINLPWEKDANTVAESVINKYGNDLAFALK